MQTWSTHEGQSIPIQLPSSVSILHKVVCHKTMAGLKPQLKNYETYLNSLILYQIDPLKACQ